MIFPRESDHGRLESGGGCRCVFSFVFSWVSIFSELCRPLKHVLIRHGCGVIAMIVIVSTPGP